MVAAVAHGLKFVGMSGVGGEVDEFIRVDGEVVEEFVVVFMDVAGVDIGFGDDTFPNESRGEIEVFGEEVGSPV